MDNDDFKEGQYEFMSHLRHHGFPSPLLDWSLSPYVALFFALNNSNKMDSAAVYAYIEYQGEGKGGTVGSPQIVTIDRYIETHKRHFMQQSEYTFCVKRENEDWYYCSHEDAFGKSYLNQDKLVKLIISRNAKEEFLKHLDQMNINAYSLFASEEHLMQTLAFREKNCLT